MVTVLRHRRPRLTGPGPLVRGPRPGLLAAATLVLGLVGLTGCSSSNEQNVPYPELTPTFHHIRSVFPSPVQEAPLLVSPAPAPYPSPSAPGYRPF